MLVGPVVALGLLIYRRRMADRRRRSPIPIQLLRSPGQTLRERIDDLEQESMLDAVLLMLGPVLLLALVLVQAQAVGRLRALDIWEFYATVAVLFLIGMVWRLFRKAARLERLRAGYDAELATGQELDRLMRKGAAVFHDIPADGFNIDHVVVARQGLFVVETKGYTKTTKLTGTEASSVLFDGTRLSFPTFSTAAPIEQAERQAAWVSKWLSSAVGTPVAATAVVSLPGWFVRLEGRGTVRVYNARQLAGLLDARFVTPLDEELCKRVEHQLDQRCRTVKPRLHRDKGSVVASGSAGA